MGLPIVSTSGDHADVAQLELDKLFGLASLDVQHDGVIHLMNVPYPQCSAFTVQCETGLCNTAAHAE